MQGLRVGTWFVAQRIQVTKNCDKHYEEEYKLIKCVMGTRIDGSKKKKIEIKPETPKIQHC